MRQLKSLQHSATGTWGMAMAVLQSRIVIFIGALSLGVAIPTVLFHRPEWLRSEHSADWASASASFIAALVALGLGLYSVRQNGKRERLSAHGAALVFYSNVTETIALLETIEENSQSIASSKSAAEHVKKQIVDLPPLLPPESLEFLPHLPLPTAKLLVICAQRVASTKKMFAFDRPHLELAEHLESAREFLIATFLQLGNQLFSQIFGSDATPPWRDPNRATQT